MAISVAMHFLNLTIYQATMSGSTKCSISSIRSRLRMAARRLWFSSLPAKVSASVPTAPKTATTTIVFEGGSYSFQNAIYVAEKEKDGNPAVDGKLEVLGGSLAPDDGINVGHSAGKTGTMIVGGGSVTSTAEAFIGAVSSATGILTVTNGTFTAAGGLTLGSGGSANGTFNLSQDGVVNVTGGDFIVCKNNAGAIGAFDVSDGTLTIANALKHGYVGSAKNATGAISGGKVSVGTDLSVGHGASTEASLTISGSADVMAKNFMVAQGSGASGDVTISGGAVAVTNLYMACNGNGGGGMGTTASLAVDGGTLDVGSDVKFGHVGGSTAVLKVQRAITMAASSAIASRRARPSSTTVSLPPTISTPVARAARRGHAPHPTPPCPFATASPRRSIRRCSTSVVQVTGISSSRW